MRDEDIIHIACINSYRLIILQDDLEDIYDYDNNYFAHNPYEDDFDMEVLDSMLRYFTEIEDYDKCIKIRDYIKARTN